MKKSEWQIQVEHTVSSLMKTLYLEMFQSDVKVTYDMGLNMCYVYLGSKIISFNCGYVIYNCITDISGLLSTNLGETNGKDKMFM